MMWTLWLVAGLAAAADDDRERALRAPRPRHMEASCAALVEDLATPVPTLRWVAESVPQPPWVAVRAAGCLVSERPTEARDDLLRWVRSPEWAGLARVAVGQLDQLPGGLARELATAAVQGPLDHELRELLRRSENVDVQAVLEDVEQAGAGVGKK